MRRVYQIRSDRVRERCGSKSMYERVEEGVLKFYGHMERMMKMVYMLVVEETKKRGTLRRRSNDRVEEAIIV